jgi:hypothetical protein
VSVYHPYDRAHRRRRDELLAELVDGGPCFRCGDPMYRWQRLHADHSQAVALNPAAEADVLSHGSCNEAAGARLGNAMRGRGEAAERPKRTVRPDILVTSRDW